MVTAGLFGIGLLKVAEKADEEFDFFVGDELGLLVLFPSCNVLEVKEGIIGVLDDGFKLGLVVPLTCKNF